LYVDIVFLSLVVAPPPGSTHFGKLTTLIQLAWLWLRYQPDSALAIWFRERVGTLQGRTRRIAIVAMARKLLIALWRYVETGVVPDGVEIRSEASA
jgi:transposase